ncbi:penicillin-binding protein 1C [Aliikangiella coralliicola]|nr:penicillin-binding protein 1C [Aliikangiella coralliicola]
MWKLKPIKKRIFVGLTLLAVLATFYWHWLPKQIFEVSYSPVALTEEGRLLDARVAKDEQWRFPARTEIPEKFKVALMTFEDKRFESHFGVDFLALARAIKSNLVSSQVVSGASTITMQTIRLSRNGSVGNRARSYWEKVIEMLLAVRLEMSYSKQEILAMYTAHAPFGGNVVGLEAASWRYFGRAPAQLSWAESAMLAVLPNSPTAIHLKKNRSQLKQKRDRLLARLWNNGVYTEMDYRLAMAEPLPRQKREMPKLAPHLIDTLSKKNVNKARPDFFHTTLSADIQQRISQVVKQSSRELQQMQINHAAALVIDNRDLSVKAYVGNSDFSSRFNSGYAIDLVHRPRSSGSVFKPLLFATMLEQGEIISTTLIPDLPTQYSGYAPENYDRSFRGAVPAKMALAQSLNIPSVRLLRQYGLEKFYDFLQHAGITTLHRTPDDYGLPLILGGAETTLWDIAQVYANLATISLDASQQNYKKLSVLSTEKNTSGRKKEISQGSAWLTLEALLEVTRPGAESHWKNFHTSQKIAWKTGTSYGLRDGWAIGVTPKWTVAVWVGNADGRGVPGLTGVGAAAPLMFSIFNQLDRSSWFETPYHQLKEVTVCKDNGYLSNGLCDSEIQLIAKNSHFDKITPHHFLIHLDKSTGARVHSECERVRNMSSVNQFVLPPGQEFYYQKQHSDYVTLPSFRADCLKVGSSNTKNPMSFLYPGEDTHVYIPRTLDGQISQVVFEAVHRKKNAQMYWHIDDRYLGQTQEFHQRAIYLEPGWHQVTIIDNDGFRTSRRFKVLGK